MGSHEERNPLVDSRIMPARGCRASGALMQHHASAPIVMTTLGDFGMLPLAVAIGAERDGARWLARSLGD